MRKFLVRVQENPAYFAWVQAESPDNLEGEVIDSVDLNELRNPDYQGFMDACDLPPRGNGLFSELLKLDAINPFRPFRITDALPYLIRGARNPYDIGVQDLRTLNAIYQQYIYKEGDSGTLNQEQTQLLIATMKQFGILVMFLEGE